MRVPSRTPSWSRFGIRDSRQSENEAITIWKKENTWIIISNPGVDSLSSEDYTQKILAVMDHRIGKRSLQKPFEADDWKHDPVWVKQFFVLRFHCEGIGTIDADRDNPS